MISTGFTTVPSSVVVGVREEAVFMCRYPGASINWRINGSGPSSYSSDSITVDNSADGQRSDTLRITALPEYNGTEVVCVALLSDFTVQRSVPAHLIVDGKFIFIFKCCE